MVLHWDLYGWDEDQVRCCQVTQPRTHSRRALCGHTWFAVSEACVPCLRHVSSVRSMCPMSEVYVLCLRCVSPCEMCVPMSEACVLCPGGCPYLRHVSASETCVLCVRRVSCFSGVCPHVRCLFLCLRHVSHVKSMCLVSEVCVPCLRHVSPCMRHVMCQKHVSHGRSICPCV